VLKELKPGIYVETSFEGGNVGLILCQRGAVLVDTPMLPSDARRWQATLRQLGASKIYGIVNTDYHPEHFLGNTFFMPARVFGHELGARQVTRYRGSFLEQISSAYRESNPQLAEEISHIEIHGPELCVADHTTLHMGDRHIEILHLNGHTPASLAVYLPDERVLFAGDNIVYNEHPVMSQANSLAWLASLDEIRRLAIEVIVPGSGNVCSTEVISPLAAYIAEMRHRVSDLFQTGASRRECVDKVGMLDFFPISEEQAARMKRRRRENVERVYAEIRMAQPRK
jgi:cyclase